MGKKNRNRFHLETALFSVIGNKKRQRLNNRCSAYYYNTACSVSHCLYIDKGYVSDVPVVLFYIFARPNIVWHCSAVTIAVRLLLQFLIYFFSKNGGCGYYYGAVKIRKNTVYMCTLYYTALQLRVPGYVLLMLKKSKLNKINKNVLVTI